MAQFLSKHTHFKLVINCGGRVVQSQTRSGGNYKFSKFFKLQKAKRQIDEAVEKRLASRSAKVTKNAFLFILKLKIEILFYFLMNL